MKICNSPNIFEVSAASDNENNSSIRCMGLISNENDVSKTVMSRIGKKT